MQIDHAQVGQTFLNDGAQYQQLIESLPVAIYTCDANGYILQYNKAALELWGRAPVIGVDQWCGSWKIYHPDGTVLPIDACPMAIAIREGRVIADQEIVIERRDGTRYNVLPHPRPVLNADGQVVGAVNMLVDITARRNTEKKLQESEDRLRLATEGTQLATWDLNLQSREIIYSPKLAGIFGHPDSKILSHQDMRNQIHPADIHTIVEKAFELAMQTGAYHYEARVVHPDKSIHWIRTNGKVLFDEKRTPLRMLGTMMDITEQREAAEKIEKLAAIVQSSDDAIISKTLDGIITSWNAGAQRIFGYTQEEMIGQPMTLLFPPDRINEESEILRQLQMGQRIDHFETIRVTKDKRILNVSLTISPIKDPLGNVIGASKIARDITKQKQAEQIISASEEKFRLLADSMPEFVWTGDKSGVLNYFNQSVYNYSGLTPAQIAIDGWIQIVHPDEREENIKNWLQSVATGRPFLIEHRFRRRDGQYRWQLSRAEPQRDSEGNIQMWVGTSTDIHDRKLVTDQLENKVQQRTKELNKLNEDLVRSNIELAQFAYVASHDLQEPLRKIQSFSTRILELEADRLSDIGKAHFDRMLAATARMKQLIIDLLSYSRTGSAERNFEKIEFNKILQTVLDQLKETIDQRRAVINWTNLPLSLYVIPFQFEQLLMNILTNALKFSKVDEPPVITISVDQVKGSEIGPLAVQDMTYHRISFKDNGIGFDPQYSARIFQVFQRLHGRDEYAGTGIGLSIVKKIIENHHGFITTESELDKGADFIIHIPAVL